MKQALITNGLTRAVRVGLGGALIGGFSVIGVGIVAGSAGASTSSTPAAIVQAFRVPIHCMTCLNPQPLPP
jgi:hypothetical protein